MTQDNNLYAKREAAHLSEEQLDEILMGEASPKARAHLESCAACRAAVAPFQTSVAAFNQASMAWSEARSNTLTRDLSDVRIKPRLTPATAWSFAGAAVVVVGLIVSTVVHQQQDPLEASVAPQPQMHATNHAAIGDHDRSTRDQEIAADNALLGAIDSELRPQPLPPAFLPSSFVAPTQARRGEQGRD